MARRRDKGLSDSSLTAHHKDESSDWTQNLGMSDADFIQMQQDLSSLTVSTGTVEDESGIYLFLSYDLVNSTKFKVEVPDSWPQYIYMFYQIMRDTVESLIINGPAVPNATVWKYGGDEVLFFVRVQSTAELRRVLIGAWQALDEVRKKIETLTQEKKVVLSVKGTAWVAKVKHVMSGALDFDSPNPVGHDKYESIRFDVPALTGQSTDFLGPDIDTGFRVAKAADKRIMVVSAELAYLLSSGEDNQVIAKHFRIVGYESLKGVWNERHYPVVWYHGDWDQYLAEVRYDDHLLNPLVRKLCDEKAESSTGLARIFNDKALKDKRDWWDKVAITLSGGLPPTPPTPNAGDDARPKKRMKPPRKPPGG